MTKRPNLVHLPHGLPLRTALSDILGVEDGGEIYRKLVRRLEEEPLEELGHGGWGVAYRLPSGKVLKVTSDWDEMDAAGALAGQEHPNLVRIHDAFAVDAGGGAAIGVISREWVEKTLEEVRPDLSLVLEAAAEEADQANAEMLRAGRDRRTSARHGQVVFIDRLLQEATLRGEPLLWDIVEAVDRLRRLDLVGYDFHGRNVGLVDLVSGEPRAVVFDFGRLVRKPRQVAMLGAARRWLIRVETPEGEVEGSVHMIEEEAKAHVSRHLEGILKRVRFQMEVFREHLRRIPGELGDYYDDVEAAVRETEELLERDDVWEAVNTWMLFQTIDAGVQNGGEIGPPPFEPLVGRIRVETY